MAISTPGCTIRTAVLFGAALAGLMIPGAGPAKAAPAISPGCAGMMGQAWDVHITGNGQEHRNNLFNNGDKISVDYDWDFNVKGIILFRGALGVFDSSEYQPFPPDPHTALVKSPSGSLMPYGIFDVNQTNAAPADIYVYFTCMPVGYKTPTVSSVSPIAGKDGDTITIGGVGFRGPPGGETPAAPGATAVMFGSTNATSFTVNGDTSITATVPACSGTVDVTVTTPVGTTATRAADQFTYGAAAPPAPTVTAVSPGTGPAAGFTSVTITGTNFTGEFEVDFGGEPASFASLNSATSITADTPASAGSSTVEVTVTTAGGTSATSAADQFSYGAAAPPTVTAVAGNTGPPAGGTSVTITGSNFTGATAVQFGSTNATSFDVASTGTSITTTAPAGGGIVDVTVTTAGGTSATSAADQFTYIATHDFNGDGKSDILWRDTSGNVAMWLMNGNSVLSSAAIATVPNAYSIVGQGDFSGGGIADLLWRDNSGNLSIWFMNGLTISSTASLGNVPTNWTVKGTADMSNDRIGAILWQDTAGDVAVWSMFGSTVTSTAILGTVDPSTWSLIGSTSGAILWRDTSGNLALWQVSGSQVAATSLGAVTSNWRVVGLGDFNGDGNVDILFRDSNSGTVAIWFLNSSAQVQSTASLGAVPNTWSIVQTGDFNGDGKSDILWEDSSDNLAVWFMNGGTVASSTVLGNVGTTWQVQNTNAN